MIKTGPAPRGSERRSPTTSRSTTRARPTVRTSSSTRSMTLSWATWPAPRRPRCDTLVTPGGSCSFGVSYTVQQSDPDPLVNVVTVHYHPAGFPNDVSDTDDHSLEVERELAQLAHTQTTCEEFITQTGDAVPPLTELTYGLRSDGTINNVSPGVFFFYASYTVTGSQGALTVDAAERFNSAVGPVDQRLRRSAGVRRSCTASLTTSARDCRQTSRRRSTAARSWSPSTRRVTCRPALRAGRQVHAG